MNLREYFKAVSGEQEPAETTSALNGPANGTAFENVPGVGIVPVGNTEVTFPSQIPDVVSQAPAEPSLANAEDRLRTAEKTLAEVVQILVHRTGESYEQLLNSAVKSTSTENASENGA